jgi:hypothetical protein
MKKAVLTVLRGYSSLEIFGVILLVGYLGFTSFQHAQMSPAPNFLPTTQQ